MFSQLGEAFPPGNAASYSECLKPHVTVDQAGARAGSAGDGCGCSSGVMVWCPLSRQALAVIKTLASGQVSGRVGLSGLFPSRHRSGPSGFDLANTTGWFSLDAR